MRDSKERCFSVVEHLKGPLVTVATICILSAIIGAVLTGGGEWYLDRFEAHWRNERIRRARAMQNFVRPIVHVPQLAQNAATWYRLAFNRLEALPPSTSKELQAAVEEGTSAQSAIALLESRCVEALGARVRNALSSERCDWELSSDDDPALTARRAPRILGYCLILEGNRLASAGDAIGATDSYLDAVAFGSDMSRGDFRMAYDGMAVAKAALDALGGAVGKVVSDTEQLNRLAIRVSALKKWLPTANMGLRFVQLQIAEDLLDEAREHQPTDRMPWVLPWRAFSAWRLSREERILDLLGRAAETDDVPLRKRLRAELVEALAKTGSAVTKLPSEWIEASAIDAEYIARLHQAVSVSINLQKWRVTQGKYPDDIEALQFSLDADGLRYRVLVGNTGYRIEIVRGYRAGTSILEHVIGGRTGLDSDLSSDEHRRSRQQEQKPAQEPDPGRR